MYYKESFFTNTQEPYSFLLKRREWETKRMKILARDNYTCQCCGKQGGAETLLQVHHKHYIHGLDPWEYKDSELITLCEKCHSSYHEHNEVPVYSLEGGNLVEVHYTPCSRCGGAGWFPQYKHVQGGVCFRCHGAMYDELISVVENYAKEYNISIEDLDDGFRPFPKETIDKLEEVRVRQSKYDSGKVYVRLLTKENKSINAYLDYSIDISPETTLDIPTLRYKLWQDRFGKEHMIIKGIQSSNAQHFNYA